MIGGQAQIAAKLSSADWTAVVAVPSQRALAGLAGLRLCTYNGSPTNSNLCTKGNWVVGLTCCAVKTFGIIGALVPLSLCLSGTCTAAGAEPR
jgi:hypothetical protein